MGENEQIAHHESHAGCMRFCDARKDEKSYLATQLYFLTRHPCSGEMQLFGTYL